MKRPLPAIITVLFLAGCSSIPPADYTDKSDICPLHGIQMQKKTVRVIRGFPKEKIADESHAATRWFPYGLDYVQGALVKQSDDPKKAIVYVCPDCVIARNKWYGEWQSSRTNDVSKKYGF